MSNRHLMMVGIFSLTVFLSASLLFVVQPMVGKMILPHLGGSSSVWTTCMLFFQTTLVAGYVYAHLLAQHVEPKHQAWVHLAIMGLACVVSLPLGVPPDLLNSESTPALWLMLALTVGVGLPLFVVSTSAPLFQRWFSYTDHPDNEDPYYLYAASNIGSMVALLGYPFVVEPLIGVANQRLAWSAGFVGLLAMAALCGWCLWQFKLEDDAREATEADHEAVHWKRRLRWVGLAFVPSSLMLGVTQYLTTDLASVPLLWVLPLAIYLLSFIFVFARRPVYLPPWMRTIIPLMVITVLAVSVSSAPMSLLIGLHLLMFFFVAMFFHGELAKDRPQTSGLTDYFIWMSVGGALGGFFNALVAPMLFARPLEYTGMLVVAVALIAPDPERVEAEFNPTWTVPILFIPLGMFFLWMLGYWSITEPWKFVYASLTVAAAFGVSVKFPKAENLAAAGILAVGLQSFLALEGAVTYERSFYASYAVYQSEHEAGTFRKLSHGTTAHGIQGREEDLEEIPLGYHHTDGPVGQVMESVPSERVAVAGLGVGAMAAYGGPDREMVFYEIDPVIETVAREHFTYLDQCGKYCEVRIGDARKLLEQEPDGAFDVIFMDAYNSDSVPTHLLTREAMELYLSKVDEDGVVVFHVSNRFLDIEGVVGSLAEEMDLATRSQIHFPRPELQSKLVYTSAYSAVAREEAHLRSIADDERWRETVRADVVWTDDYSNIVSVFDWSY